ncbi:MAG: DUF4373 domain-containing protein [Candidatus Riflebacteria bacterium]
MARPTKQGIDYYPMDNGFYSDLKVRRIQKACGPVTGSILTSLLCNIYSNGYYILWNEDLPFLVADEIGATEGAVFETVQKALQVGFFDEDKFREYEILTSKGIQERYLEATARRKSISLDARYWIIQTPKSSNSQEIVIENINQVNEYNNKVNADNNPENVAHNEQSKVKESKVNSSNNPATKKTGIFEISAFLPESENQSINTDTGKITAKSDQIIAFFKVLGAGKWSPIEEMAVSRAIEQGCTVDHLRQLLKEKPKITSFAHDWVVRELIAIRRRDSGISPDSARAELEKTYGG